MIDSPFDFPADITRTIFEDASKTCRKTALVLISLSSVVRRWVEPIMYYQVSLRDPVSACLFRRSSYMRNDYAFFARTIRKLTINMEYTEDAEYTIALCINLVSLNIIMSSSVSTLEDIPDMRYISSLKSLTITEPHPIVITIDKFPPNVTHLRIMSVRQWWTNTSYLRNILRRRPSIVYLMFDLGPFPFDSRAFGVGVRAMWRHLQVETFPHPRLFIVVSGPILCAQGDSWQQNVEAVERLAKELQEMEPRTVVVNADREYFGKVNHMLDMDFDEEDIWDKAEEYLVKRGRLEKGS